MENWQAGIVNYRFDQHLVDLVHRLGLSERAAGALAKTGLRELSLLLLLGLAAGGLWAFIGIADEVSEGEFESFDSAILLALRTPGDLYDPLGPVWFEEMVRDVTALGGNVVAGFVTLASACYLVLLGKRRGAVFVLLAVGSGILMTSVLKAGFDRPRPDLVEHATTVYTSSFPSGHSMTAGVVYLTLAAILVRVQVRRRLKAYLLGLAVLVTVAVGCSRVYLGVHWPSDILAGWAAGAAWAILWWCGALWMQRQSAKEDGPRAESDGG